MSQAKSSTPAPTSTPSAAQSVLSASVKGTTFLILVQVVSRGLTFIINQTLLRYLSPQLLGVSLQLELYSVSVLYFARESVRVATQRQTNDAKDPHPEHVKREQKSELDTTNFKAAKTQEIVNVSYLPILLGVPLAWGLGRLYMSTADERVLNTPNFQESLYTFGFAALLELLTEPCFAALQQKMLYKTRVLTETAATIIKGVLIFGSTLYAQKTGKIYGVFPFALGQMGFAVTVFISYFFIVGRMAMDEGFSLLIKPIPTSTSSSHILHRFSSRLLSLSANMYFQAAVKHILTQGDTFILAMLSSLEDQGLYGLASNYGGLVARMVFQPIEESSRNVFAKLLSSSTADTGSKDNRERNLVDSTSLTAATAYLHDILRIYNLIFILACSLGPTILPQVFRLLIGSRWANVSSVDNVLASYCYYIPIMAYNGISEAFVSSVASNAELQMQSAWMAAFTAGFAGAAFVFLRVFRWGAVGLVWANVVNMLFRIAWSAWFISGYLRRRGGSFDVLTGRPSLGSLATGVAAGAVLSGLQRSWSGRILELAQSAAVAGCTVCLIIFFERRPLMQYYSRVRGRKSS